MCEPVIHIDYYSVLNVNANASLDDIKKSYRKLALIHHPDKNPGSNQFHDIAQAYEILSNPERRNLYDRYGPSLRPNPTLSIGESLKKLGPLLFSSMIGFFGASGYTIHLYNIYTCFGIEFFSTAIVSSLLREENHLRVEKILSPQASDFITVVILGLVFGNLTGWLSSLAIKCSFTVLGFE